MVTFFSRHHIRFFTSAFLVFGALIFVGAACTRAGAHDGGAYRSDDGGETWKQIVAVDGGGEQTSIDAVDVTTLRIDPTNPDRLFVGTAEHGMYVSDDRGEHWRPFVTTEGAIVEILVNPQKSNAMIVARPESLHRSDDGGETWKEIYTVSAPRERIRAVSFATAAPQVMYIGLSSGDVMKSDDGGSSWARVYAFSGSVEGLVVSPQHADVAYVALRRGALAKTIDGGKTWIFFREQLSALTEGGDYRVLVLDPTKEDAIVYGTSVGLVRTRDGGKTWDRVQILSRPYEFDANALAMSARDGNMFSYVTDRAFFSTRDGGEHWKTIALPSTRAASTLLIHPRDANVLYLGMKQKE